jgi:hypothetical protein
MLYLIRVADTKADEWVNGHGNAQSLAQHIFRAKQGHRGTGVSEESTYYVENAIEETRIAAAYLLTNSSPKLGPRYLIRIYLSDVVEAGLGVEDGTIGETGVGWVDFRHRDLVGTKAQFQALVDIILERLRQGHDRIRRIGQVQFDFALRQLRSLPATETLSYTRSVIDCVLNGTPIPANSCDIATMVAEISNLSIPHDVVALRAFCLEESARDEGSPPANWHKALKELRHEYRLQHLPSV